MNVVEWTINNFSYYNVFVHQKNIEKFATGFFTCPRFIIYPRGFSGWEEQLVVQVYGVIAESKLSGHLFCIDSSGSVISTQEINEKTKRGNYHELLPKLKFTEVRAQIRKNEILHQDRFTLRFELKCSDDRAYRLYTTIEVFDSSMKIGLTSIGEVGNHISTIKLPLDECRTDFMGLSVTRQENVLSIKPASFKRNVLVSTSLSVLKFDSVTRTEENEHVFKDSNIWPFTNSLTREELTEDGFSLCLRIKIAPSNRYKHPYGYYTKSLKSVDVSPTDVVSKNLNDDATSNKPDDSVTVLLSELVCLYRDHEFSDFQLRCGEVSIPTHKSILSARSPVFRAMLHSNMSEAASDSMDIEDLDVHTLGRFLVFLYTGTVEDLGWKSALKLYYAADKYQVPTLKRECFSVFHDKVSVLNVCDILSLADRHQDEELTLEAYDFILKNYNNVLRSEGWKTFMKNEPLLAVETLTSFAEKNIFNISD